MADPHRVSSTLSPSALAATHQLLDSLWDGQPTPLSIPLTDWVTRSKSFFSFAQTNQGKIRKKIRICRTLEETYNLYCELRTAYLLLQEPKFALAYEPAVKEKGRSADFAVTFRTHTPFHVEVTRLTVSQLEQQVLTSEETTNTAPASDQTDALQRIESRLAGRRCLWINRATLC
ncbi:MAG: hypothetical protein R2856_12110 [Caldilineaceae bacterium]